MENIKLGCSVTYRAGSRPTGNEGSFGAVFPPGALVGALQRDDPGRHVQTHRRGDRLP